MERDEALRMACFLRLDILRAQFGEELPWAGALEHGFRYGGARVPFFSRQKGIFRAAAQRGSAALSIQTSVNSPYADAPTDDGFRYAYQAGNVDHPDNRALRAAYAAQVPVAHFVGVKAWVYEALYPCYVTGDDPIARDVVVSPGAMVGPMDEREPAPLTEIERRYAFREVKVRLHQRRFRWRVIPAYDDRCAVCRLKEIQLLDAAHIAADVDPTGIPAVSNGLSLCTIHHRAYDQNLVGVDPDYEVHVSSRLLEDEDGPMLDVLKGFHGTAIHLPKRSALRPDRDLLEARFAHFVDAA